MQVVEVYHRARRGFSLDSAEGEGNWRAMKKRRGFGKKRVSNLLERKGDHYREKKGDGLSTGPW